MQHYRYWVVWRCPSVRFLDYEKVKQSERDQGQELFGTAEEPTELATSVRYNLFPFKRCPCPQRYAFEDVGLMRISFCQIMSKKSKTFEVTSNGSSAAPSKLSRIKLTDEEKQRLQEKIKKATSLQEIIALEKELNEGRLPSGIYGDAMEE